MTRTSSDLLAFQMESEHHLGISLTRACPLRCAHCAISTVPSHAAPEVSLSSEHLERLVRALPELSDRGLRRISFTGGEPTLALRQLVRLSVAAAECGVSSTVVTAAQWATSRRAADRMVGRVLPAVDRWQISTDAFHLPFVPVDRIVHAALAAVEADRRVTIRMSVSADTATVDEAILAQLRQRLPGRVELAVQPVMAVGRAKELSVSVGVPVPNLPCVTTGPLIRDDGSVAPCCASLAEAPATDHPFAASDAEVGPVDAWRAWQEDPLLQLVRTVGFAPVVDWLQVDVPEHPRLHRLPSHPCDVCTALWSHAPAIEAARRRAAASRGRIAELKDRVFAVGT